MSSGQKKKEMSWLGFGSNSTSGGGAGGTSDPASSSEALETALLESTKASLVRALQGSIKELQVQFVEQNTIITTDEGSDRLLAILEAVFIHGLKDSFLGIKGKGL